MQKSPISAPSLKKVSENPSQYFFIYKTLRGGEERMFDPNTHVWATYLELVNAKDQEGKQLYAGFDKPPFNNFVKWTQANTLIKNQDPQVVATGKEIVSSINTAGAAQAEQEIATTKPTEAPKPVSSTSQATATAPTQSTQTKNEEPKVITDMETSELINSFKGLAIGSKGPQVDSLQRTIAKLGLVTKNNDAVTINRKNIKAGTDEFDKIYGPNTALALQTLIGSPEPVNTLDDQSIAKIKNLVANTGLLAKDVKPKEAPKSEAPQPKPQTTASQTQKPQSSSPSAAPTGEKTIGPNSNTAYASRSIETNKGKIYF